MTIASLEELGDVFVTLADPNRRAVMERLAIVGEGTATTIARDLPLSRQAVVKHLAHLDRVELVTARRSGQEMRDRIQPEHLAATAEAMALIATAWDKKLDALKRHAEETYFHTVS